MVAIVTVSARRRVANGNGVKQNRVLVISAVLIKSGEYGEGEFKGQMLLTN